MMKDEFSLIFSLDVQHSFFENGICNCLFFEPAIVSEMLMKRFGFRILQNVNGFGLYCSISQPLPVFFDYIKRATFQNCFEFNMATNDQNFWAFTDLPPGPEGQIDYTSEKISRVDNAGLAILQPSYTNNATGIVGSIKIVFDDIQLYKKTDTAATFRIEFQSKSTQWQYYIINKSSMHVENPAINGKLNINFDGPVNVQIPTGEQAMLFTSANELLPLSQKPKFQLDLINKNVTDGENATWNLKFPRKILFKGLPWPDPGSIGMIELNGRQVFASPMYIYL